MLVRLLVWLLVRLHVQRMLFVQRQLVLSLAVRGKVAL
jgi:hypothetical protein